MTTIEPITPFPGKKRRTLMDIPRTVSPDEIFTAINAFPGWPYSVNKERMLKRDRAYVLFLYVAAVRASEAGRILKSQFKLDMQRGAWLVRGVKLSKERTDRPRVHSFREEIWLPLKGERANMTQAIIDYVKPLPIDSRVFPFGVERGRQIVKSLTGGVWNFEKRQFEGGLWNHYFRAQGERYLYRKWKQDLIKTANYLKIDPRTLIKYLQSEQFADLPAV